MAKLKVGTTVPAFDPPEDDHGKRVDVNAVQKKFSTFRDEMNNALIERDQETDLLLTALIAGENPLFVGPPGVAKSLLADSLLRWLGGKKFTVLFTKFTTPEEVFGPISIAGLREDKYRRVTTGKLPEADIGFLDEVFKASSAILNTLLRILNERLFEDGEGGMKKVPLKLCVAASNEWPSSQEGGKELAALFDRFLLRKTVRPVVSQAGRQRLLWHRDHTPEISGRLHPHELEAASQAARMQPWSAEAMAAMEAVLHDLAKEGVQPGDRRQYKAVGVCQAYSWLNGAVQVEPEHLEVLAHVLWDDPLEQPDKVAKVVARIANPTGMKINGLIMEVEGILNAVEPGLVGSARATNKLDEIVRELAKLPASAKTKKTTEYIQAKSREIKRKAIESC